MSTTVAEVLADIGAVVDQDTTQPTGTELTVRVNLIDRSQRDWAEFYLWDELRTSFTPTVQASMTSIGLPTRFSEFRSPLYDMSTTAHDRYIEIKPSERFSKNSDEKYFYVQGNDASGRYVVVNPPLASGASLVADIQSTPSSLATVADTITCPSREFLVKRGTYYILQARSDTRFQIVQSDSETLLRSLVEDQDSPSGAEDNRIPDWTRSSGFRIGRDG